MRGLYAIYIANKCTNEQMGKNLYSLANNRAGPGNQSY